MRMLVNWNRTNNDLSAAVVATGRLGDLLVELGCDVRGDPGGVVFRGPCPVHLGDGHNFEVRADGHTLDIRWACYSHHCHRHPRLKNTLLGLIRGALTHDPDHPATFERAVAFIETFLADAPRARTAPSSSRPARPTLSLTRQQVRGRLTIPSPYFINRGFAPAVLDAMDIGDSAKLGRAVVPIYDDGGTTCVGAIYRSFWPTCGVCEDCHPPAAGCRARETRWKFVEGFHKSDYLFNYAAAARSRAPLVLLVEGVPDVLRATEAGIAAVACFGHELSVAQSTKLSLLNKRVVAGFDNDDCGRAGAVKAINDLRRLARAEVRHPPFRYKDVGEMPVAEVAAWLAV
jgi:hypothetical protein